MPTRIAMTARRFATMTAIAGFAVACETTGPTQIAGAGATFPYPMYSKWFDEYHRLHPAIQVNYQSIGSGGGIRQVTEGTVDFGASDGPMTDDQLVAFRDKRGSDILHFPTVLGAVVPVYNVDGVAAELRFTPEALAGMFLGTITKWNDKAIAAANPGVTLPATEVVVVHRSDGSGTTFVWTDYLSKVSADWKTKVGANTSVNWPAGIGGKGNEGISGLVKQTNGAIGYVELVYALQSKIAYGSVRNAAGEYVNASLESVSAAAATAPMPDDFRVSITNAPGATAYPIASFTWLLVPAKIEDPAKHRAITEFLKWMLTDGQPMAAELGYAPLPTAVVERELKVIAAVK